jgi:hypothetical protein
MYGESVRATFDDRVLAHLQIVVGLKLRRNEGFFLSWHDPDGEGAGRNSIWIDSSIPLIFRYNGGRMPKINREWLEILTTSSNSSGGLQLTDELRAVIREEIPLPAHLEL